MHDVCQPAGEGGSCVPMKASNVKYVAESMIIMWAFIIAVVLHLDVTVLVDAPQG